MKVSTKVRRTNSSNAPTAPADVPVIIALDDLADAIGCVPEAIAPALEMADELGAVALRETAPGRYEGGFKLRMIGEWEIRFHVTPKGARPFDVVLLDRVRI